MTSVTLLQSFALDKSGQIVSIESVSRGASCECLCPICGGSLLAKQGDIRVWHFAHIDGNQCAGAAETALHMAAKFVIHRQKGILLPSHTVRYPYIDSLGISQNAESTLEQRWIDFERVLIEEPVKGFKPDVTGESSDTPYFIEIKVTHAVDDQKSALIHELGFPAIEIDLSQYDREGWTWATLEESVLRDPMIRKWIYCPVESRLADEARQRAIALSLFSSTSDASKAPVKHGLKINRMLVYVTEFNFGTTVWSSYHPDLTPLISGICRKMGGRWNPAYRNWIVNSGMTRALLEELRGLESVPQ